MRTENTKRKIKMNNPNQSFAIVVDGMQVNYSHENLTVCVGQSRHTMNMQDIAGKIIANLAEELYSRMSRVKDEELCHKVPVRELQTLLGMVEKARRPRVCYSSQPMDMMEAAIEETKRQLEPVYQTLKAYCAK